MEKIERVSRALEGREVDYVPFAIWRHFSAEERGGAAGVAAHVRYYRESGIDFTKVMDENGFPFDGEIRTIADWDAVRPLPLTHPAIARQLELARRVADELAGECLVFVTMFSPYLSAGISAGGRRGHFYGDALMNTHLREDPVRLRPAFDAIAETKIAMAEVLCRHGGIAGFYFSSQGAEAGKYPDETFDGIIKSSDLAVISYLDEKYKYTLLHICGADMIMERYKDYPCTAVNWAVARNALALDEGRRLFGKAIFGGINNRGPILGGSRGELEAEVAGAIGKAGSRGFLLGGDCTIPSSVPMERLRMVTEASKAYSSSRPMGLRRDNEAGRCHE